MVKGLYRSKFAAVDFYSGKLCQGDLRLHINLFTMVDLHLHTIIICPGNTSEQVRFSVSKKLLISRRKKHKTQIVEVKFLKFQSQVNKRVNPNWNLPCQKYKRLLQFSGV